MAGMELLSDRIKWIYSNRNMSQSKLARAAGVKAPSVKDWEEGNTRGLRADVALNIAKKLNVNIDWLITGNGSPETAPTVIDKNSEEYVHVYLSRVVFQAGYGAEPTIEEETSGELIRLRRTFFDAHHLNAAKCTCFPVEGESMQPLIYEGEYVIVDTTQNDLRYIKEGKIYAISVEGLPRIKRLFTKMDGSLIIRSENKNFGEDVIRGEQLNTIKLIGRVVARIGAKPFE